MLKNNRLYGKKLQTALIQTVLSLSLVLFSVPGYSQQASLLKCQKIKNNIKKYNILRRNGGSPKQMESWKQRRKKHKEKFEKLNCEKWKKELK